MRTMSRRPDADAACNARRRQVSPRPAREPGAQDPLRHARARSVSRNDTLSQISSTGADAASGGLHSNGRPRPIPEVTGHVSRPQVGLADLLHRGGSARGCVKPGPSPSC